MDNNDLLDKFWDLKEKNDDVILKSINFIVKTYFESKDQESKE